MEFFFMDILKGLLSFGYCVDGQEYYGVQVRVVMDFCMGCYYGVVCE